MRALAMVAFVLLLAGCGRRPAPAPTPSPSAGSALAAPVLAPMAARERLLHDLGQQQQQARQRAATVDDIGSDPAAGNDR